MNGEHRLYQSLLAAYVLDPRSLTADENQTLTAHLESCPECRREEAELRSVVASLDAAAPDVPSAEPTPDLEDRVVAAVLSEHPEEQTRGERSTHGRSERWRLRNFLARPQFGVPVAALTAALAFVVVAFSFPFLSGSLTGSDGPPGLGETEEVAFTGAPNSVSTDAAVVAHTWGTELDLKVEGLKPGEVYAVNIERREGGSVEAGTFVAVPDNAVECRMNGAVLRQDARAVIVTNSDGDVVMRANLEPAPALASAVT